MSNTYGPRFPNFALYATRSNPRRLCLLDIDTEQAWPIVQTMATHDGVFVLPQDERGLHFYWDEVRRVDVLPG